MMRKKLIIIVFVLLVIVCRLSVFFLIHQEEIDIMKSFYQMAKSDEPKPVYRSDETELKIYVEETFAEKYGKEFEFLGIYSYNFKFSRDCNIRCVEDGIEFQAKVSIVNEFKIETENYLLYKYFDVMKNEVMNDTDQYFDAYTLVTEEEYIKSRSLDFDTSADLSYEEFKEKGILSLCFYILIPEDAVFSEEEWSVITEKFSSSEEDTGSNYRQDIDLDVYFAVFRVSNEIYDNLESEIAISEFRRLKNNNPDKIIKIL